MHKKLRSAYTSTHDLYPAMTLEHFEASLSEADPPAALSAPLRALWLVRAGRWEEAHVLVQDEPSPAAAWVHAYLHREEGDLSNAAYWYRRAGRPASRGHVQAEWRDIAHALLAEP
jgi:hypothetical protein